MTFLEHDDVRDYSLVNLVSVKKKSYIILSGVIVPQQIQTQNIYLEYLSRI